MTSRHLPKGSPAEWRCLKPHHPSEAMKIHWAAKEADRTPRAIRNWCEQYGIGRRALTGGSWSISRVALQMVLDGDMPALNAYLSGQRQGHPVAPYYERLGLGHLLELPEFKSAVSVTQTSQRPKMISYLLHEDR